MYEIPNDLLKYFFSLFIYKDMYLIEFIDNGAILKPRELDTYYKPDIIIKDLDELEKALIHYIESLNEYILKNNLVFDYDLSYFFRNLLFNMSVDDALDLVSFINKRSFFFSNEEFSFFDDEKLIKCDNGVNYYAKREIAHIGLETHHTMNFEIEINGIRYHLPLVRYAFDKDNTCYIYAIQFGGGRVIDFDIVNYDYKAAINRINSGVKKYRNASPGYVTSFSLFIKMLQDYGVTKIVIPGFLFGRYKHYYHNQSIEKSDAILERIITNNILLCKRMEYQFEYFHVESYPGDADNSFHIRLGEAKSNKIAEKSVNL